MGVQVRQNTKVTQASMRQSIANNDITFLMTFLNNQIIAEATYKTKNKLDLTGIEWEQLVAQQQVNFRVFENAYYQYSNGLLEQEVWSRYQIIIKRLLLKNDAAIEQWKINKITFTNSFQEEINDIINNREIGRLILSDENIDSTSQK